MKQFNFLSETKIQKYKKITVKNKNYKNNIKLIVNKLKKIKYS